jgi:ligand-binding sensor domain-containing protein
MQLLNMIMLTTVLVMAPDDSKIFQPPQWQIREFHAPSELSHEEVKDIILAQDGAVWFANMAGGVTQIKDGLSTFYNKDDGLISNYTDCILEDSFGGIWVGTREGISYIYQDVITNFSSKTEPNISDDLIDTIAMNSKGEIWFGTGDANLFFFTPQKIVDKRPVGLWKNLLNWSIGEGVGKSCLILKIRFGRR